MPVDGRWSAAFKPATGATPVSTTAMSIPSAGDLVSLRVLLPPSVLGAVPLGRVKQQRSQIILGLPAARRLSRLLVLVGIVVAPSVVEQGLGAATDERSAGGVWLGDAITLAADAAAAPSATGRTMSPPTSFQVCDLPARDVLLSPSATCALPESWVRLSVEVSPSRAQSLPAWCSTRRRGTTQPVVGVTSTSP